MRSRRLRPDDVIVRAVYPAHFAKFAPRFVPHRRLAYLLGSGLAAQRRRAVPPTSSLARRTFRAQGQVGHSPVHERRPEPDGLVRSEARCSTSSTASRTSTRSPARSRFIKDAGALMRSPFKFAQHGQCGAWVSDVMPHLAGRVDDIAFIRSMYTTNLTHEPAIYIDPVRARWGPAGRRCGSWVVYGLGSENQNLPAYVVLDDPLGLPINGVENWQAGFLPPVFQGTRFRSTGSPVLNLQPDTERPPDIVQSGARSACASSIEMHKDGTTRPADARRPHRQLRTRRPHAARRDRCARHLAGDR